jgi:hypothetical protein
LLAGTVVLSAEALESALGMLWLTSEKKLLSPSNTELASRCGTIAAVVAGS